MPVWVPPRPRTREQRDRHATWLELFSDLVFVVAIAEAGAVLLDDVSWTGAARFTLLFVAIWWAWTDATFYADRFDTDDAGHRLITLLEMLAIAALAAATHGAFDETGIGFSLAYVAVRAILLLRYWRAGKHVLEARPLMNRLMLSTSAGAAFWLTAAFVGTSLRPWLWLSGIVATFAVAHNPSTWRLYATVPLSASHLPERFGLLTIIVLGETVTAVVAGLAEHAWHLPSALTAAFGVVAAFAIWWVYFENTNRTMVGQIERLVVSASWLYSHLLLLLALTAFGVGVELAVLAKAGPEFGNSERALLVGSVVVVFGAMSVLAIVPGSRRHMTLGTWPLVGATVAALGLGLLTFGLSPIFMTGFVALIAVTLVLLELMSEGTEA